MFVITLVTATSMRHSVTKPNVRKHPVTKICLRKLVQS